MDSFLLCEVVANVTTCFLAFYALYLMFVDDSAVDNFDSRFGLTNLVNVSWAAQFALALMKHDTTILIIGLFLLAGIIIGTYDVLTTKE